MAPGFPSRRYRPSRQLVLFLVAIGLPCLLLVGLSLRMLVQERELAEKRVADERRRVAAEIRQELLSRLERLRREAIGAAAPGKPAPAADGGAIALVARIDRGRVVLPWDTRTDDAGGATLNEGRFATAVRAGERDELVARQFDAAASSYRLALQEARLPSQAAFAQLLLARALTKAQRGDEAAALYRRLVAIALDVLDEEGIPFALYAARRLLDSSEAREDDHREVLDTLRTALTGPSALSPAAVYMVADLTDEVIMRAAGDTTRDAANRVAQAVAMRRRDIEQALALQLEFATVVARVSAATSEARGEPAWVPFGAPAARWLVGIEPDGMTPSVVAIRADLLLASLESARAALRSEDVTGLTAIIFGADGEALGPSLPGLALAFEGAEGTVARTASLQRSFYLATLALVVTMALFGGYLFWRDVRREVRVAALRSQFVSSVSHELKTPLTAIRIFAETLLLRPSTRPDVKEEYLETIVNESERLTRLLNNVLDFSKIEQGRKTYRIEPLALDTVVRNAAKAMAYPLSQQGIELRVQIEEHLPPVPADADAIQQAILNLLSNAMKYSGNGRVVDLHVTRQGDRAVIVVTDHGLGIPVAEQAHIFEKFYRIGGADRDRIPGTGLGLTLVDHVVKAHGGAISVRSAPGEGSTFSIVLPMAPGAAPKAPAEEALA